MNKITEISDIIKATELGEGQFIEFKESLDKSLAREIVAFANASGGVILLGITDAGQIKGIEISNRLKSQIQDIAYNCDPAIILSISDIENVLVIEVLEGKNKPYSCSAGFYMRMGANAQKMSRDEILSLSIKSGKVRFDEQICSNFDWKDFDDEKFIYYLKLAGISYNLPKEEILQNTPINILSALKSGAFILMMMNGLIYLTKKKWTEESLEMLSLLKHILKNVSLCDMKLKNSGVKSFLNTLLKHIEKLFTPLDMFSYEPFRLYS